MYFLTYQNGIILLYHFGIIMSIAFAKKVKKRRER